MPIKRLTDETVFAYRMGQPIPDIGGPSDHVQPPQPAADAPPPGVIYTEMVEPKPSAYVPRELNGDVHVPLPFPTSASLTAQPFDATDLIKLAGDLAAAEARYAAAKVEVDAATSELLAKRREFTQFATSRLV